MKIKTLLGLAFILTITFGAKAQEFGVRVGGNVSSTISETNGVNIISDNVFGFHLGATGIMPIGENLKINGSLLYYQKGAKTEFEIFNITTIRTFTYNYLHMPLALEYSFNGDQLAPYIQAGPYFSYTLGAKNNENGETLDIGNDQEDDLAPFDMGLNFGAGIDYQQFRLGISYELGLANTFPSGEDGNDTRNNRSFNLNVSYFFNR
ncbi:porin family protein [Mangrovivirga sp. M17]|uniref:Porin family protein n=1 Tax=Mangrovivirga halotolerans TaxID=2993936 RepID=A0ABT3RV93_9BACT|nr:porin family protein [Mangrovivirga halotolerans]MCX2745688.1 porin family protein [Mangrovivirga halotolerans]